MIIVLFHVLYLVGKFVYQKYQVNKRKDTNDVPDRSDTPEQLKISLQDYKRIDIDSVWDDEEDTKPDIRFSPPAYIQRYVAVQNVLNDAKYQGKLRKVVDFGCSEFGFLLYLKNTPGIEEILCVDVDRTVLESNTEKTVPLVSEYLHCRIAPLVISVYEGSVADRDKVLEKTDAVICIELIEHLYPDTLTEFPINVFGYIKPKVAIVTTPNADFNVLFPNLRGFRHADHKFEWTREQFQNWAENIILRYPDYSVTFHGICKGPPGTEHLGACTQMAIFHREEEQPAVYPVGIDNLFKLVSSYEYPYRVDNRSDEQKIVDEAAYYIHQLSYGRSDPREEVPLERLLQYLTKFSVTLSALKTILEEAGWAVVEGNSGPVVVVTQPSSHSDISLDETWTDDEGTHDSDSISNDSMGNDDGWNDEPGLMDIVYVPPNMNSDSWDAEPSIIIPENRSIHEDNSYLFDGDQDIEHIETLNALDLETEIGLSLRTDIDSSNPDTPRSSTQMTSDDLDGSQNSATMTSVVLTNFSGRPHNPVSDLPWIDIADHSSTPQKDSIELRYTPGASRTLDYRAQMSISRASTSPPPLAQSLYFNELSFNGIEESDDSMMNNTFRHCDVVVLDKTDDYLSESLETKEFDTFDTIAKSESQSTDGTLSADQNTDSTSLINTNNCMLDSRPQYTSSPRVMAKRGTGRGILRARRRNDTGRSSAINQLSSTSQSSFQSCSNMSSASVDSPFVIGTWCPGDENIKHDTNLVELKSEKDTINTSRTDNSSELTLPLSIQQLNRPVVLECENSANSVGNKSVIVGEQQTDDERAIVSKPQNFVKVNTDADIPSTKDTSHVQQSFVMSCAEHINKQELGSEFLRREREHSDNTKSFVLYSAKEKNDPANSTLSKRANPLGRSDSSSLSEKAQIIERDLQTVSLGPITKRASVSETEGLEVKLPSPESLETSANCWSPEIGDSGYPNSASAQDITPEYDLSSIAQDQISDSESSSGVEVPRVKLDKADNNDLVNNNRNCESNNVNPEAGINVIHDLQPLIHNMENDIGNENNTYALENEFPLCLHRLLDITNPNDEDMQEQAYHNLEQLQHRNVAAGRERAFARADQGFDSSSTFDGGNEPHDDHEMQNDSSNDDVDNADNAQNDQDGGKKSDDDHVIQNDFSNDDDDNVDNTQDDQDTDDDGDDGDDEYESEVYAWEQDQQY